MTTGRKPLLLSAVLPALADELAQLLRGAGRVDLAAQVPLLKLKSRCDCGDDFCATIDTRAGRPADSIDLEPSEGMIIVDVDDQERILGIEILDRPEYKTAVDVLFSKRRTRSPTSSLSEGEG